MRLIASFWRVFVLLTFFGVNAAVAASSGLEFHCSGGAILVGNTNLGTLQKILALPSTTSFEVLSLENLSKKMGRTLSGGTNGAALLKPVVNAFIQAESAGVLANGSNYVLACRLAASNAQPWQAAFSKVFDSLGEKFSVDGVAGQIWKPAKAASFWMLPINGWIVAGAGDEVSAVRSDYIARIKKSGGVALPADTNWLDLHLDVSAVKASLPAWMRLFKPGNLNLQFAIAQNHFRATGTMRYATAPGWKGPAWQTPTQLVRDPLVSFTAARDIAPFLDISPTLAQLAGGLLTNQFYCWALGQLPLQSYLAWPQPNATNYLTGLATVAPGMFDPILKEFDGSQMKWQPEKTRLFLKNLQMVAPELKPAADDGRGFVLMSLFPLSAQNPPATNSIWQELNSHTNLVYYDFEQNSQRLYEWLMLSRMLFEPPVVLSPEEREHFGVNLRWLTGLRPVTGNTVTAVTQTSPVEYSLIRHAPLGLTAIELVFLSDWLTRSER